MHKIRRNFPQLYVIELYLLKILDIRSINLNECKFDAINNFYGVELDLRIIIIIIRVSNVLFVIHKYLVL